MAKLLSQEHPDYVFYVTLGDPSGLEHPPKHVVGKSSDL